MTSVGSATSTTDGLLLVGHGTRDPSGTREFFALADVLAERLAPMPVQGCLLEFQKPSIPEAWEMLVKRGVKHIRVAPLLLFAAGHARADIPEITFACASATPGITHSQSGPLSRAPSIIGLLENRIGRAIERMGTAQDDSIALVMVGRGSFDPCARTDMQVLSEITAKRCGFATHAVGFYAMAEPKLPSVLDEIARRPGVRSVVVQPHLLFQGKLYDAICQQVADASQRNPDTVFVIGDYLGPTAEVADALARRVLQADAADPVGNV